MSMHLLQRYTDNDFIALWIHRLEFLVVLSLVFLYNHSPQYHRIYIIDLSYLDGLSDDPFALYVGICRYQPITG
jgi:hypothetical protein